MIAHQGNNQEGSVEAAPSRCLYRWGEDDALVPAGRDGAPEPGPALAAAHAALRSFVEHDSFPCIGAKAALTRGAYVLGEYGELGDEGQAAAHAEDMAWFAGEADRIDPEFATFLAIFPNTVVLDEEHFERTVWTHLQAVHEHDRRRFAWDPGVSDDPADPDFAFSAGGRAFFVIGMHPSAEREARRFPFPALVFNLHDQFESLREQGRFERMRATIREREEELEGKPNPVVADHGTRSEAPQYAGQPHRPDWKPPHFKPDPGVRCRGKD